jgi:hypothetical protein
MLAGTILAACGVAGPESRTFVGPVTVVDRTRVCIGGADASGECFVRDRRTRNLRVNDCVRVSYLLHSSAGPSTASGIQRLSAADHAGACPPQ